MNVNGDALSIIDSLRESLIAQLKAGDKISINVDYGVSTQSTFTPGLEKKSLNGTKTITILINGGAQYYNIPPVTDVGEPLFVGEVND